MPATLSCLQMRLFDVGIRMVENNSESQIQRVERNIRGNLKSGGAAGRAGARALEAGCGRGPVTASTQDPRPRRKSPARLPRPSLFRARGWGRSYPSSATIHHLLRLIAPSLLPPHLWSPAISPNGPDNRVERS